MKKLSLFSLLFISSFCVSQQCSKIYSLPTTCLSAAAKNGITNVRFSTGQYTTGYRNLNIDPGGSYIKIADQVTNQVPGSTGYKYGDGLNCKDGVIQGEPFSVEINPSEGYDLTTMGYYEVWVDLNDNGLFEPGEKLSSQQFRNTFLVTNYSGVPYPAIRIFRSATKPIDFNSCGPISASDTQAVDLLNGNPLSLATEQYEAKKFSVYPNPSSGIVNFSGDAPLTYRVFDLSGNLISNGNGVSADLSQFSNGLYLIRLDGEDSSNTIKVIKTN